MNNENISRNLKQLSFFISILEKKIINYIENGCAVKYIHVFDRLILKPTKKETASNEAVAKSEFLFVHISLGKKI